MPHAPAFRWASKKNDQLREQLNAAAEQQGKLHALLDEKDRELAEKHRELARRQAALDLVHHQVQELPDIFRISLNDSRCPV
jgi:chromosome segregation ATPase